MELRIPEGMDSSVPVLYDVSLLLLSGKLWFHLDIQIIISIVCILKIKPPHIFLKQLEKREKKISAFFIRTFLSRVQSALKRQRGCWGKDRELLLLQYVMICTINGIYLQCLPEPGDLNGLKVKGGKRCLQLNISTLMFSTAITVQTSNFAEMLWQWFIAGLQQPTGEQAK